MNLNEIRNIDALDPLTRTSNEWIYGPIIWPGDRPKLQVLPPHVVAFNRGDHLPDGTVKCDDTVKNCASRLEMSWLDNDHITSITCRANFKDFPHPGEAVIPVDLTTIYEAHEVARSAFGQLLKPPTDPSRAKPLVIQRFLIAAEASRATQIQIAAGVGGHSSGWPKPLIALG